MSTAPFAVVIAGGGTGGHVYPGLAVAQEITRRRPTAVVSFAGTSRGLEARLVPAAGFALDCIRSAGLKGKALSTRLRGLAMLAPSFLDAWRVVSNRRPAVVVGVGGYSSGPVVFVAALRGVPTLVLEQNAVPGLTNRLLSRVVRAAAVTYQDTAKHFRGKAIVTGNPVRREFFDVADRASDAAPRVLVMGGSQGAHAINVAAAEAGPLIASRVAGVTFAHQTGSRDLDAIRSAYAAHGLDATVEAFFDPVVTELARADLVVCRAGATTLAELAASGRPAVFIPFPAATDDHQRRNGEAIVRAGAAEMIVERDLTPVRLADVVVRVLTDSTRRSHMRSAMRRLARPSAAAEIVDKIEELAS